MTLSPFSMLDIFYTFLTYFHPSFCIHYCYNRSWRFILKMPSSATSHMFCFMPSSSPSTVWMPVGSCSTIWHMYSWFTTGLKNLYLCLGCLAFDSRLDKTDLWYAVLYWNSAGDPQISSLLMVCYWFNQLSQFFLIKWPEKYFRPSLGTSALSSLKCKLPHTDVHGLNWRESILHCLWIRSSEEFLHRMSLGPLKLACISWWTIAIAFE